MNDSMSEIAETAEPFPGNRILKVDHAGEFGAINIYRAQILFGKLFRRNYVPYLEDMIEHERRHLAIFGEILNERGVPRCRSFWLCGIGGFFLGFVTSLLGKNGVMACTTAVENVVLGHLHEQMDYLQGKDEQAYRAIQEIVADEEQHRDIGNEHGGDTIWYKPVRAVVAVATESVIWL